MQGRRDLLRACAGAAGALLAGAGCGTALAAPDAPATDVEAAVRAVGFDASFKDALVGVAIVDVDSGQVLGSHNPHLALNPASNAKLVTAAAALSILRPEHRFETTLSGAAKAGATGTLVLRGHGDPSLEAADLWSMVQELRGYGVRRVDGDLVVDQRFFDEAFVPPAFEQQPGEWAAFRAPVSALAVNENTVTMSVRPTTPGQPAHVTFDPPGFVDVEGVVTTGEAGADTVTLALAPSGKRLSARVGGAVAEGAKLVRYTRRVDDPSLLGGYVLRALLEQAGIKVSGEVKAIGAGAPPKVGPVLVRHASAPLAALLPRLGKQSDNFYAEMIYKALGGEAARPARADAAAAAVTRWLDGIGANERGVVVKNGSGLFDANRTTAASTIQVLRAAWRDPAVQPEFLAQLAVGGVDGTLHKRFRAEKARRAVRAKTGTLDDAIALSGYVLGPPGKGPVAFAIYFNKVTGKAAGARAAADKLVEIVARSRWGK